MHPCTIVIDMSWREVAKHYRRRPPTGRTNGRFSLCCVVDFSAVCGGLRAVGRGSLFREPASLFCNLDYQHVTMSGRVGD
jgi:hypothetical protein